MVARRGRAGRLDRSPSGLRPVADSRWPAWAGGILVLLVAVAAHAGTPGLPFLALGSGARSAALAEAMTAVPDPEAAAANPAALAARGRGTVSLTHGAWIQGIDHDAMSLVRTWGTAVVGASAQLVQADGLERRTGPSAAPLGTFGVYEGSAGMTAALGWRGGIRLGVGARLVRQAVGTETANGAGIDLGGLYPLDRVGLTVAASLLNLGAMSNLGQEATPLPRSVRLGLAYTGLPRLLATAELQNTRGSGSTGHLGAEFAAHPRLALRAGYQTGESRDLSAGLGVQVGRWALDYAYLPFDHGLGEAHRLGIQLSR